MGEEQGQALGQGQGHSDHSLPSSRTTNEASSFCVTGSWEKLKLPSDVLETSVIVFQITRILTFRNYTEESPAVVPSSSESRPV